MKNGDQTSHVEKLNKKEIKKKTQKNIKIPKLDINSCSLRHRIR